MPGAKTKSKRKMKSRQQKSAASLKTKSNSEKESSKKIRYAMLGLGHIGQVAVLPAFKNAYKNSELTTLISGDPEKLKKLGKKYKVKNLFSYEQYDEALKSGLFDAVYIALPNDMHREYAIRAADQGIHVLCEKPLAVTTRECDEILEAVEETGICFMTAYRLHFNPANLKVIELAQEGKIGELRYFSSTFSFQVTDIDNIRLQQQRGGGPLRDIGIYCINAARYLFQAEPLAVNAIGVAPPDDERFDEVPEAVAVHMLFPNDRLASFTISFGAFESSAYDLIGTSGCMRLENAYDYALPMKLFLKTEKSEKNFSFSKKDQFGAEIEYFSNCILNNQYPEPSAEEGRKDVQIIEAIEEAMRTKNRIYLDLNQNEEWPEPQQAISKPSFSKPKEIKVSSPHS